ncbi:MAG: CDC27 family protein [Bacteriovorax sp.]
MKKWVAVLSEIERTIPLIKTDEDAKNILDRFLSFEEYVSDHGFSHLYLSMWNIALRLGKIKLANHCAQKALLYLIELKRVPGIKDFLHSLHAAGLFKKKAEEYLSKVDVLLGKKTNVIQQIDKETFGIMEDHPEHWKDSPVFLKQYLLLDEEWSIDQWKLCYEFILLNNFDKDLFQALMEKAKVYGNQKAEQDFLELFQAKMIRVRSPSLTQKAKNVVGKEKLILDYDEVAMELLSGAITPSDEEQKRVIHSLKFISEEDLRERGQDMIVAFELLGMERVVLTLCERMLELLQDVKQRASTYYIWGQALNNNGDYYKAIDLIDEVLKKEPLYDEEQLAFLYLKAEACLKLKKIKMAKEIYTTIKKHNPHYRMVKERLKAIETA